ncbi:Protein containing domains DUF403 [Caenispirillum salinarum AK4]|uniref:Protein containing domains DUF403 n=1 Tax=Caenispirillum salinarum AK4 TaxID=1238182 RepID=K9GQB9_9PROT|nr:alpha-E domain-containing protein [Caenispirillum salinarum]EKV26939.1 Protein containing domains DUF403 [Caenispirillum salinarum AK4]
MLSRTADNLYWMARYVERAENMARILDVSHRMSQLPASTAHTSASEWLPALIIAGQRPLYEKDHDEITAGAVIGFMALDPDNPSSIFSSIRQARENARAERNAIPSEMFECINAAWLEIKEMHYANLVDTGFRDFFDWVKDRSALFRGTTVGTMLQNEGFYFARLGTFIERADNTARLLDVKYHVLAPDEDRIDEAVDYYQWGALLRSLSAFKAYRLIYRDSIKPRNVAELLILRDEFPRSLHACYDVVHQQLDVLGPKLECARLAGEMHARLHYNRAQDITRRGLHRFLTEFINRNSALSAEIAKDFLLVA